MTALTLVAVAAGGFSLWQAARVDTTTDASVTSGTAPAAVPGGLAARRLGADAEWVHVYLVRSAEEEAAVLANVAEADEIRAGLGESPLKVTIFRAASPEQESQAGDAIIHPDRVRFGEGLLGVRVVDLRTHPSAGDLPQ